MPKPKTVILVVEDNAIIRMGAVDLVMSAGFDALEASDADAAILLLEAHPEIHLVFTDVDMPGSMDGVKLAHYIANRWPPVRVIVASGKAIIEAAQLPGGARFFGKPYDDGMVVSTMRDMLAGH